MNMNEIHELSKGKLNITASTKQLIGSFSELTKSLVSLREGANLLKISLVSISDSIRTNLIQSKLLSKEVEANTLLLISQSSILSNTNVAIAENNILMQNAIKLRKKYNQEISSGLGPAHESVSIINAESKEMKERLNVSLLEIEATKAGTLATQLDTKAGIANNMVATIGLVLTIANTIASIKDNAVATKGVAVTVAQMMATITGMAADKKRGSIATKAMLIDKKAAKVKTKLAAAGLAAIISSAPIVGIKMGVAAMVATAAGITAITGAISSAVPAMATGGVVSAPTFALVGEGRYPEAVVPLGESPQFASMKADIANAVLQGLSASNGVSRSNVADKNLTIQLNIDGKQFAEATVGDIVDTLNNEGYSVLRADAIYR